MASADSPSSRQAATGSGSGASTEHHSSSNNSNNNTINNGSAVSSTGAGGGSGQFRIEKKHFDKLLKLIDKLLKYCSDERMNLVNSPPYIIDILPDLRHQFQAIHALYAERLHVLNGIDYFCVLMKNCMEKLQALVDLFKSAGSKRMCDEASDERHRFVKHTLTFSHILAEMRSLFAAADGLYQGQLYRIAKKDADEFWRANFHERTIVNWREFELKLNRVHKISSASEADALRETIQLTKSRHVSIFEFDIFTRLFQPWNNLLNNWKFLVTEHPGKFNYIHFNPNHF